jgi:hypothetical protein
MIYYLAHNGNDVFNYGKIGEGQKIETGQPALEFFNTIEELELKLSVYGIKIDTTTIDPIACDYDMEEPLACDSAE